MGTYIATLTNSQGCEFDECQSMNLRRLKTWCRGRGGEYEVRICKLNKRAGNVWVKLYTVRNGRMYPRH